VIPAGTPEPVEFALGAGPTGKAVERAAVVVLNIDAAAPRVPAFSADRRTEAGIASNAWKTRFGVVGEFVFAASVGVTLERALRLPFRSESTVDPETRCRNESEFVL
jgi:hypothetical protein